MDQLFQTVGTNTQKALNTIGSNAQTALEAVTTSTQSALNTVGTNIKSTVNNIPIFNSSLFKMNTGLPKTVNKASPVFNWTSSANTAKNSPVNMKPNTAANKGFNLGFNGWSNTGSNTGSKFNIILFIIITCGFLLGFVVYNNEIVIGWNAFVKQFRQLFGLDDPPNVTPEVPDTVQETPAQRIVENVLPIQGGPGPAQVFNVETNKYSYYDAEPLCKALGAELATYDQVKESWEKGADWCNYGWIKGQMAVYPTQQETYNKLQAGPVEERSACGNPGINGGYFDNPEMKFGVNCYGPKEAQSVKEAAEMSQNGDDIPKTTEFLAFDKKVKQFKHDSDSLDLLPFNPNKWSST